MVASQGLPVAFYAELRDRKHDQAVKCELSHDRVRLIYLRRMTRKGTRRRPASPPAKTASETW